jgi:hypothetical protein
MTDWNDLGRLARMVGMSGRLSTAVPGGEQAAWGMGVKVNVSLRSP